MAMLNGLRDLFMKALFDENDVISRKILVDQWNKECEEVYKYKESLKAEQNYIHAPRDGEWELHSDEYEICATEFVCSNCKESFVTNDLNDEQFLEMMKFCPNCGARMKGGEGNDTERVL